MKSTRTFRGLSLLALVLVAAGCGYSFVIPGAGVPKEVRNLYVAESPGRAEHPEITDALVRELRMVIRRRGRFQVVVRESDADAVLRVKVDALQSRPVAFDVNDDVLDYETTLACGASLEVPKDGVIWEVEDVGATRSSAAVPGAVVTTSSAFQSSERLRAADLDEFDTVDFGEVRRERAQRNLVRDLAVTIYGMMTGES